MIGTSIEHQLLRLHVLLGDDENQLEEVYQAFQKNDTDGRGSLENADELASILQKFLSVKDFKRIDADMLAARFPTNDGRFDYTAFCKTLEQHPELTTDTSLRLRSPKKRVVSTRPRGLTKPRSPTKIRSPTKQRSPTKSRQNFQNRVRVDKRLESQRLLVDSVRRKIIRGVEGGDTEGFQGVRNALHRLDTGDEGYLDQRVFIKQFVQRLRYPLTRPEREFLLQQLQSTEKGKGVIDYEQIGRICNLDSDDSVSESESEHGQPQPMSPTKASQLGAEFLDAEKRLNEFLRIPLDDSQSTRQMGDTTSTYVDTPRCVFTGAERFLEIAESMDQENTGFLHEKDFPRILSKCGIVVKPEIVTGMLSRFPRSTGSLLSYSAFLQRYGQNPKSSRGRRELKHLVLHLLARLTVPTAHWLRFLNQRFEKFDLKVHGSVKGTLPTEAFIRVVQGRSSVLKLTTDEAAQVTSLFLRASTASSPNRMHYHEFLKFVNECQHGTQVTSSPPKPISTTLSPTNKKTSPVLESPNRPNTLPISPKPTQSVLPEPPISTPVDDSDMSVGDYLMFHATVPERRNFENLMETLQIFQQSLDTTSIDQEILRQVPNGVLMVLGDHLRVQVQFTI